MKPNLQRSRLRAVAAFVVALVVIVALASAWRGGLFQPRVQRLVRQLQTADEPEDRHAAARELGEMGEGARPAVPALVEALSDDGSHVTATMLIFPQEHYVRDAAYQALTRIRGPEAVDALVDVIVSGNDGDYYVPSRAARLLAELGPEARPAAERLLDAIDGCRQGEVVKQSLSALVAMQLEPDSPVAVKARDVLPQFCNRGGPTGRMAASLLFRLWPEDGEVHALLVGAMLSGLEPLGPGAFPVDERTIPALVSHLGDGTRDAAMAHLAAAESDVVVPALREALNDPAPLVRAGAASALAKHGIEAASAKPELTSLLGDANQTVRWEAAVALWHCAHEVDALLPILVAASASEDARVRQSARSFIDERDSGDAWAADALIHSAASGRPKELRLVALRLMTRTGSPAAEVDPLLLDALRDPDPEIQRAAAEAVAATGVQ